MVSWERRHPACKAPQGAKSSLANGCSRFALIAGKMPALPALVALPTNRAFQRALCLCLRITFKEKHDNETFLHLFPGALNAARVRSSHDLGARSANSASQPEGQRDANHRRY